MICVSVYVHVHVQLCACVCMCVCMIVQYYKFSHPPHSAWTLSSTTSLNQSVASLYIGGDLLEHFGLTEYGPTQLHSAALYGNVLK